MVMIMDAIYILSLAIFIQQFKTSVAVPIDNGVQGTPEIECGPKEITILFSTKKPFEGTIYVKGHFSKENCKVFGSGQRTASFKTGFTDCGVRRKRSLDPPGVYVATTVIITFHPHFITKVDRAFNVQCFYMEAEKSVSTEIEVSMLTTVSRVHNVPMPICRYELLDSFDGEPVRYAFIGQPVYHKWTCATETQDTFCMTVHSCYADNGAGERADLLDPNGCAVDRYLLQNLEYATPLVAGQETHVFKYAGTPQLYFQCTITITIREDGIECRRVPCSEPDRGKRAAPTQSLESFQHFDSVPTQKSELKTIQDWESYLRDISPNDKLVQQLSQTQKVERNIHSAPEANYDSSQTWDMDVSAELESLGRIDEEGPGDQSAIHGIYSRAQPNIVNGVYVGGNNYNNGGNKKRQSATVVCIAPLGVLILLISMLLGSFVITISFGYYCSSICLRVKMDSIYLVR